MYFILIFGYDPMAVLDGGQATRIDIVETATATATWHRWLFLPSILLVCTVMIPVSASP